MTRIISRQGASFLRAILKLIPSEVVAVSVFLQGILPEELIPHLVVSGLLLLITPFYLRYAVGVSYRPQLVLASISLLVWMVAMGSGPLRFLRAPWYEPWYGSVLLALWTLIPPMFLYRRRSPSAGASENRAAKA